MFCSVDFQLVENFSQRHFGLMNLRKTQFKIWNLLPDILGPFPPKTRYLIKHTLWCRRFLAAAGE